MANAHVGCAKEAIEKILSDARVPRDPGIRPIEQNMWPCVRDYVQMADPPTLILASSTGLLALQFHAPHPFDGGEPAAANYHFHAKRMTVKSPPPPKGLHVHEYRSMNLVYVEDTWYEIDRTGSHPGTSDHYLVQPNGRPGMMPEQVKEVMRRYMLDYFGKRDVVANWDQERDLRGQLPIQLV
ncbi:unnamed protein product [Symbiodinium natans]|uniref:Uncharacterized protein n=1 Tax=Symbiodinium natans TaxID=878477 RepID=A0A812S9Y7_9DINO|nr:unnamed protein product [Symbiodinium natans]